jgi:opacity protein-like surface antigen
LEDVDIMRIASCVCIGAVLLALTPTIVSAQERRVHVNFGGGPTFNAGDLGDHFANGWGPAIGVTFDGPGRKMGFQFEYAYRWFDIKDEAPVLGDATRFSANHQTHQLAFNLVANLTPPGSAVRPYLIGGPGTYYRKVEITEYVGNGVVCDPWYYVCGTYPIEDVIGSRGGWDFGFNVGGGVGFGLGESSEFFVEMRYHHVWGPEINSATPLPASVEGTSTGGSTNGSYYPLTFGFRF